MIQSANKRFHHVTVTVPVLLMFIKKIKDKKIKFRVSRVAENTNFLPVPYETL